MLLDTSSETIVIVVVVVVATILEKTTSRVDEDTGKEKVMLVGKNEVF